MIRENHIKLAGVAFYAALLCGTSVASAQEASVVPTVQATPPPVTAPVVIQPAPQAETVVAPPPVVATIPEEQLVKPAAAERPAAQGSPVRVAPVRKRTAPVPAVTASSAPSPNNSTESSAASAVEILPAPAITDEPTAIAPAQAAQEDAAAPADSNNDNMVIIGGIAAALGLAGIGAVLARRRRRPIQQQAVAKRTETVAPLASTAPVYAAPVATAEPTRPAVNEHTAPRFMPTMADRNVAPVTDPLFAHRTELGPVTDPLFSHKVELGPVTDPMFADHDQYAGKTMTGSTFDSRRTWPATEAQREMEPAE